jgi:hypothetical protein
MARSGLARPVRHFGTAAVTASAERSPGTHFDHRRLPSSASAAAISARANWRASGRGQVVGTVESLDADQPHRFVVIVDGDRGHGDVVVGSRSGTSTVCRSVNVVPVSPSGKRLMPNLLGRLVS